VVDGTESESVRGPLLAFSYAGMLWAYYLGVVAFLRDHFNLHKSGVSCSGISAGCSSAMVVVFDLSIEQGFEFGLEWQKLFDSRFFSCWFLETSETKRMIVDKFTKFGVTDKTIQHVYAKWGGPNCLHFGITSFSFGFLKQCHVLLNDFESVDELVYAALCSMRILPFFRSLGFYNGHYCCDGAVTANFSIPDEYKNDHNNVIKIGILSQGLVSSDIAPSNNFYPHEFVIAGNLEDNLIRFGKGYRDAAAFGNVLKYIAKGLVWDNRFIDTNQFEKGMGADHEQEWYRHIEDKISEWEERITGHIQHCEKV